MLLCEQVIAASVFLHNILVYLVVDFTHLHTHIFILYRALSALAKLHSSAALFKLLQVVLQGIYIKAYSEGGLSVKYLF